ncbi:MAG TPA: hypothetical protein VGQ64_01040 [Candidatus Limnocylindrales bacterium]|jgi:hypothetical protein|nr:hypothetical protein [Candidatus Limnocylindrales bacterium]
MNPDWQDVSRLAEAAKAVDLRPNATGGFGMRVGQTSLRWRRSATEMYVVARRGTTISFAAGTPEPTVDVPISLASPTALFANSLLKVSPVPWLVEVGVPLIARLKLLKGDQLLVATNQSFLRLHERPTIEENGRAIALFAPLVESLPQSGEVAQAVRLPDAVRDLEAFVDAYAIPDDVERAEAVVSASDADLQSLWRTVERLLPAIDKLLDDDGDLDSGARAAGHLALAGLQAERELERRRNRGSA